MKVVAIVQARMGSRRLPGKVLLQLDGISVVEFIRERLGQCRTLHEIVIATSNSPVDDPLAVQLEIRGIPYYRGDEQDVLDRYYEAAKLAGADIAVRVTGDCPLIDPEIVDTVVEKLINSCPAADYVSNISPPTFPDGLDVEAFRFSALEKAWRESKLRFDREHVTPYIRAHPESFPQENVSSAEDYSHLRWTLDEDRDYDFLCSFVEAAREMGIDPRMAGIEHWLIVLNEHPGLSVKNRGIYRNEGSKPSSEKIT